MALISGMRLRLCHLHQSTEADNFQNVRRQGLPCYCKVRVSEIRRSGSVKVKHRVNMGHVLMNSLACTATFCLHFHPQQVWVMKSEKVTDATG